MGTWALSRVVLGVQVVLKFSDLAFRVWGLGVLGLSCSTTYHPLVAPDL